MGDVLGGHRGDHGVGTDLGVVRQDDGLLRAVRQGPVDTGHGGVGRAQPPVGAHAVAGQERAVDPQTGERRLRGGADQRPHRRVHRAPGHDDLHPRRPGQDVGRAQGVGHHGQVLVAAQFTGQGLGRTARTEGDRVAGTDQARRGRGDGRLLRGALVALARIALFVPDPAR